jgi:crossover junction endodeoxyribonuclease RuvC
MRVIGVDPGTRVTGYGIIESDGVGFEVLDHGCIGTSPSSPLSRRYKVIYDAIRAVIARFSPDHMAVETPFLCKNTSSAFKLSQVRGVILLAGSQADLEIYEYAPRRVKQAVVGHGAASKGQVQNMVLQILSLDESPLPEDASDALGVAICHIHSLSGAYAHGKRT